MESCVAACLDSLIRQTIPPLHIIIVEDGSTDASAAVIDTFAKNDQRFTVISTNGIGAGAARNRGMQEVSAPYFMLLDGDDVFHPTMIESLYRAAADGNADIAICDMQEMDDATGAFTHPLWALKQSQLPPTAAFDGWRAMSGNLFAAGPGTSYTAPSSSEAPDSPSRKTWPTARICCSPIKHWCSQSAWQW